MVFVHDSWEASSFVHLAIGIPWEPVSRRTSDLQQEAEMTQQDPAKTTVVAVMEDVQTGHTGAPSERMVWEVPEEWTLIHVECRCVFDSVAIFR